MLASVLLLTAGCTGTAPPADSGAADVGTDAEASDAARADTDAGSTDAGDDAAPLDVDAALDASTACALELCDVDHLGSDDDCDSQIDESCTCVPGTSQACFRGEARYRGAPGCYDGVERCGDDGHFGACEGGFDALADRCFEPSTGCHPIEAHPFEHVDLSLGVGDLGASADPGSERWSVTCPPDAACPPPTSARMHVLQSGQYTVTYERTVAGAAESCTYPLFVRGAGLRIELMWEHPSAGGVDLDLHVHQPANVQPWALDGGPQDCGWATCSVASSMLPSWFAGGVPPAPVEWLAEPGHDTCYDAPQVGALWAQLARGCHNPRLDTQVTTCDPAITDPEDAQFCLAENANVDVPPMGQWIRIGVHDASAHGASYDVHPRVRIFCDGAEVADLGPSGFYAPSAPVTFTPADGAGTSGNRFWPVADVAFVASASGRACVVRPLHADETSRVPVFTIDAAADTSFAPQYAPVP